MILVFAGTQDARALINMLLEQGYEVLASVVSEYGKSLLNHQQLKINDARLTLNDIKKLAQDNDIDTIIDASHPYAEIVSENALTVAKDLNIKYIRYERATALLPEYEKLMIVESYHQAAKVAGTFGNNIFLTTGSKTLDVFLNEPSLKDKNITVRVLPSVQLITKCQVAGLTAKNIVALQGPFSHELNLESYKKYQSEVIITKNSGIIGGTDTKISAAISLNLPIIMIARPKIEYINKVNTFEAVLQLLNNKNGDEN